MEKKTQTKVKGESEGLSGSFRPEKNPKLPPISLENGTRGSQTWGGKLPARRGGGALPEREELEGSLRGKKTFNSKGRQSSLGPQ